MSEPISIALERLIKAACAWRDHDFDKDDCSPVLEELDNAVDAFRKSAAKVGRDQRRGPRIESILRHMGFGGSHD